MKNRNFILILIGVVLVPVLLYLMTSIFFVSETENVVVTRFGDIQYAIYSGFDRPVEEDERIQKIKEKYSQEGIEVKTGAGLYFKVPFIDQVHSLTARLVSWDGEKKNVSTKDLRTLSIDTVGFYRIINTIKFYRSFKGSSGKDRIGGVIDRQVEDELSRTRLIEAVRNENLELEERVKKRLQEVEEEKQEGADSAKIRYGRKELIRRILEGTTPEENEEANGEKSGEEKDAERSNSLKANLMNRFGIELTDVMFTQLNYTAEVRQNVYKRMISERKRIAQRYRSQGEKQKSEILGEVEREKNEILSKAEREVKNILGKAEQERIKIHAQAYGQNPEFFRFYQTLQTYRESLNKNATFILSDDNRLLRFVTDDRLKSLPGNEKNSDANED